MIFVSTKRFLERYKNYDINNDTQKEYKFLDNIISCCEKNNVDDFVMVIKDYETISKFDNLKINLLTNIKKNFEDSLL